MPCKYSGSNIKTNAILSSFGSREADDQYPSRSDHLRLEVGQTVGYDIRKYKDYVNTSNDIERDQIHTNSSIISRIGQNALRSTRPW